MIVDVWMLIVFLIATGLWSEWRNRSGMQEGMLLGFKRALEDNTARDEAKKEEGAFKVLQLLNAHGIIVVDNTGTIITGYNNNKLDIIAYRDQVVSEMKEKLNDINKT